MSEMMITPSLVKIKEHPPYTEDLEGPVLLNSLARAQADKHGSYSYTAKLPTTPKIDTANVNMITELHSSQNVAGVGVDQGVLKYCLTVPSRDANTSAIELISSVPSWNETFVARNYTEAEASYCRSQPDPAASFAARWAGKEATFKSLGVPSKGAGASLRDIEILPDSNGAPTVTLHGDAKKAAHAKKISKIHISLSHSDVSHHSSNTRINHRY
jgi:fatty acid synthase subunit alpha